MYNQCPRKYRHKYIDWIPEDFAGKSNDDAMQFGSYIHKVFEDNYNVSSESQITESARSLRKDFKFSGREAETLKAIKNFNRFNNKLTETVGVEEAFVIELEGTDYALRGYIDRIVKGKNGGLLIIDWKTSKRAKTKVDLYKDTQMKMYAFAASHIHNVPIEKITVGHYYPIKDELVTVRFQRDVVYSFINTFIKSKIWEIRKKKYEDFPPRANIFCDWCGYKFICPAKEIDQELLEKARKLCTSKVKKFYV